MDIICAHCSHQRTSHNLILHPTVLRPPCRVVGCKCPAWQPAVT